MLADLSTAARGCEICRNPIEGGQQGDYTDLTVSLFLNDAIHVSFDGKGKSSVAFTWTIPWRIGTYRNGNYCDLATPVAHPIVSRPDSTSPFQFMIRKKGNASASSSDVKNAEALNYDTSATAEIDQPQGSSGGWTGTYASGRTCPD